MGNGPHDSNATGIARALFAQTSSPADLNGMVNAVVVIGAGQIGQAIARRLEAANVRVAQRGNRARLAVESDSERDNHDGVLIPVAWPRTK